MRRRSGAFTDHELDLATLVADTAEEYRFPQRNAHSIRWYVPPVGPVVYAEPESLGRAIGNLMSNAIRLAPSGSTVTVAVGSRSGWTWTAVRDAGPGIAESEQQLVFERFRRASNAEPAASGRRGSGLGLTIARQIVESHEGRMSLFSELGVGSTFVIWLPDRAVAGGIEREPAPPVSNPLPAHSD
ncbi:sensor histidine kinase [Williamsia sp. M5A3_1d]